jgi:hypothetical protein
MGRIGDEYEMSFEDQLSPFAPPPAADRGRSDWLAVTEDGEDAEDHRWAGELDQGEDGEGEREEAAAEEEYEEEAYEEEKQQDEEQEEEAYEEEGNSEEEEDSEQVYEDEQPDEVRLEADRYAGPHLERAEWEDTQAFAAESVTDEQSLGEELGEARIDPALVRCLDAIRGALEELDRHRAARRPAGTRETWGELETEAEEGAPLDGELVDFESEALVDEESWVDVLGRLLNPGLTLQRVQELLGAGLFGISLLSRFESGQIWNEDHLALELLFHRQPKLRPAGFDRLSGSDRLKRLATLAVRHQRDLTPIREQNVRPLFGNPANFKVGPAQGCQIRDLRQDVRGQGRLKGGEINGRIWYKRSDERSPRKSPAVDSIVLHHMAFNRGNDVTRYLSVGAHYAVLADGQIAQLYDDLDFLNASNGFNPRSVAIEFAGNFPTVGYHWWKSSGHSIPERCYLTPAQGRAGRCLLATLKARLPGIRYVYAHRQSSASREGDPGPDLWHNVAEWAITNLGLTDRLPSPKIDNGSAIPDAWRVPRGAVVAPSAAPARAPAAAPARVPAAAPARTPPAAPVAAGGPLDRIVQIASASPIARYRWFKRGVAPAGYIKGMALVYARVYCKLRAGDPAALEMAKANTGHAYTDALAHYAPEFAALGMSNAAAGADTLRHLFVLLVGLGMRESSGRYCEGRDRAAANVKAETAEAGLFQTSYNAKSAHPTMPQLFRQYAASPSGFLDVFREGVRCTSAGLENFGTGDGAEFQRLSKACPAFAAEFTAVGLRNRRRHWGPINRKGVEIRPECDAMLLQVQRLVDEAKLCPVLR